LNVKLIDQNMAHQVVKKNHLRGRYDRFYPYLLFIGIFTFRGQRGRGLRIVDSLFRHVRKSYNVEPLVFFRFFFEKFRPKVFMYPKRIAGITYKIPTPVTYRKSVSLLLHWWIHLARKNRGGQAFFPAFLREMDNAYKLPTSNLSKKRDEVHKLAHFNRPFLRYLKF
jgi:ribosomal protein S7